jgi:hypothetical protein
LAIKSTHKKRNFDKTDLAQKLDNLAENVSKRGVYVIVKEDNYYHIVEALRKDIVLSTIYTKALADKLTSILNRRKKNEKSRINKCQGLILKHTDLMLEAEVYKHTIKASDDVFRKELAFVRLDEVNIKTRSLDSEIAGCL